jgi:CP family cyanate transporter-like MFS transporter
MSQDSAVRTAPAPRLTVSMAVALAIPLLALNLRPAVASMGLVLRNTGMSAALAAVVVAVPVWCFAVGGGLAWAARARWGTRRTVAYALAVLCCALLVRVAGGPQLLLAGTIAVCLAIAVLGTLLPAIVHAAPPHACATLTGCYIAALGGGSGVGALLTPAIVDRTSWQVGASSWALLAGAGWLVWRVAAPQVPEEREPGPRTGPVGRSRTAWALTVHFGLTSGLTFTIMGWLPSILVDRAGISPHGTAWLFALAMALGVPVALRVPRWAGRRCVVFGLAAPTAAALAGLLLAPAFAPWMWAAGLGLGMPAVGLSLAVIAMRAPSTEVAAALSSMVQGIGYALAGVVALAAGLLFSTTHTWQWPLTGLLVVLCGQLGAGIVATRRPT